MVACQPKLRHVAKSLPSDDFALLQMGVAINDLQVRGNPVAERAGNVGVWQKIPVYRSGHIIATPCIARLYIAQGVIAL